MMVRSSIFLFFCTNVVFAGTRIYFSKCALNGFTCVLNGSRIVDVKYECPKNVNDVLIYLNQFSSPPTIETLEIKNCNTLTLSTRCTGESKRIRQLVVTNIQHLAFQRLQYEPMLPPTVILKDIGHIQEIPFRTFAQIERAYYSVGCNVQPNDFQNLYFQNVNIDVIQSGAFVGLNQFKNFSFVNVTVKTIQTSAIRVKQDLTGVFEIKNSSIDVVEHLGIQIITKRSIISGTTFVEITSGAINGTAENFYFTDNDVHVVHPHGFSVLATNIFILQNNFLHLKSAALENLSPGLIQDSGRSFGKLKFVYDFSKNLLKFVDAGSLNPDYVSYENVQTDMMVSRNKFLCTCENMGWLFSELGHGPNTAQLDSFYEMILEESYANVCDDNLYPYCAVPIKRVRRLIECGKCLTNIGVDDFCNKTKSWTKSSTDRTTTDEAFIDVTMAEDPAELTHFENETLVVGSGASISRVYVRFLAVFVCLLLAVVL